MIEVKNIKMSYGKTEVLKDVSFSIKKGDTVGLLGSNGAGKSTIMNIITGYLQPVSGQIYIDEIDILKQPQTAKTKIGYLPEIPPLYKDMKVKEYLMFVARIKGIVKRKEEVLRVLALLNLKDRQEDFIKKLSKGLQQRVGFAQALLGNPPILVLDEPLSGLDPAEAKRTKELLKGIRQEHAIIISSHILSEIEELCNDIIMLKDGEIVIDKSTIAAKRKNNKNEYRLVIKGDKDIIYEHLMKFEGFKSVQYITEKEKGVFEFIGTTNNNRDIRDSLFGYIVSKKFSVYGIDRIETSLEDVFIELSNSDKEDN